MPSFRKNLDVEVNQQAHLTTRKSQVGEQLSLMNWSQAINGLNLYNDRFFDEKVQAVATIQLHLSIDHGQWLLLLYLQAAFYKFKSQTGLVGGLQQSRSQIAMYLNSGTDNALRDPIQSFFLSLSSQRSSRSRR